MIEHIDPGWAHDPDHTFINAGRFCTTTDESGNTAIEFCESETASVNIVAKWVNEAIQRDVTATFTAAELGELADAGPTTHVPSPSLIKAAAAATAAGNITVGPVLADGTTVKSKVIKSTKVKKQALHKIRFARVYKPFGGKRVLQVRVSGKKGMAALRITIKLGKTTHTYKRFVLANNLKVAVKNLPIPAKTAKVTVSLIS